MENDQQVPEFKKPKSSVQFLDQDCAGYKKINIKYEIIITNEQNVYLFGAIGTSKSTSFSVRFNQMKVGGGLGFVDSKLKSSSYIANEPNVVTYISDKTCRIGTDTKQNVGKGYKQNEAVTVSMDNQTGRVTWLVDGQIRHSAQYELLKNKEIQWVPYIRMCDKGDKMEIIFE